MILPLLLVLFIAVPLVELAVVIKVGQWLGVLPTVGLLLVISIAGAYLVKREGLGVLRRIRGQVAAGQVPGWELLDAACILVAGLLLLVPGFVTDAVGLLLLLPPVRAGGRALLRRRFRMQTAVVTRVRSYRRDVRVPDDVDARSRETDRRPLPPPGR